MGLGDHTHAQIVEQSTRDRETEGQSALSLKSLSIRDEHSTSRPHGGVGEKYVICGWRQHGKEGERRGRWRNGPGRPRSSR